MQDRILQVDNVADRLSLVNELRKLCVTVRKIQGKRSLVMRKIYEEI